MPIIDAVFERLDPFCPFISQNVFDFALFRISHAFRSTRMHEIDRITALPREKDWILGNAITVVGRGRGTHAGHERTKERSNIGQ